MNEIKKISRLLSALSKEHEVELVIRILQADELIVKGNAFSCPVGVEIKRENIGKQLMYRGKALEDCNRTELIDWVFLAWKNMEERY